VVWVLLTRGIISIIDSIIKLVGEGPHQAF